MEPRPEPVRTLILSPFARPPRGEGEPRVETKSPLDPG